MMLSDRNKGDVQRRVRIGWLAGSLLLIAGLVLLLYAGLGRQHVTAEQEALTSRPSALPFRGAGELVAREEVTLVSRSSLRVASVLADTGDQVVRGQVLLELDVAELEANLAAARAGWDNARQAAVAAQLALQRATVLRQQTGLDGERAEQLSRRSPGALAVSELDARQAAARTAALDASVGQSQWHAAEAAEALARANWQAASARLEEATLRAPFDGVVIARACSVGDVIAPGQPGLTLVAPDSLRVQARFDESLLSLIRPGDTARVWLKSQPLTPIMAQVVRLNRAVDSDTREFSVDLQLASLPTNWALGERAMVEMQQTTEAVPELCPEQPCADVPNGLREWKR
jgi:HlyD family secretion protein